MAVCLHLFTLGDSGPKFSFLEEKIDVRNVDLKKMRVKQLKKILQSWDEECNGCIEKSDFVQRIEELKDKHTEL